MQSDRHLQYTQVTATPYEFCNLHGLWVLPFSTSSPLLHTLFSHLLRTVPLTSPEAFLAPSSLASLLHGASPLSIPPTQEGEATALSSLKETDEEDDAITYMEVPADSAALLSAPGPATYSAFAALSFLLL